MICVVSGSVGDGKSYFCISRLIVPHLLRGGVVATNMRVNLSMIETNFHRRLNPRQLIEVSAESEPRKIPCGDLRGHGRRKVIVVLDEALNWFASRGGSQDERKSSWGEWLRQSDKLGQNVYFVAQNFERSAKWIRELAAVLYQVSSLRRFRFLGISFGRLFGLSNLSVVREIDVKSGYGLHFSIMRVTSHFWQCYDTSELYGFDSSYNAYSDLVVYPPFRFPTFAFVLPVICIVWGLVRVLSS